MVEGARLESVYTGNRIVGSNPTPSAIRRFVATRDHGAHLFQRFREAWRQFDAGGDIDGFEQTLRWNHEGHLTVPQSCVGFGASPYTSFGSKDFRDSVNTRRAGPSEGSPSSTDR